MGDLPSLSEQLRQHWCHDGERDVEIDAAADHLEALTAIAHFAERVAAFDWEPIDGATADFAVDAMSFLRRVIADDAAALAALEEGNVRPPEGMEPCPRCDGNGCEYACGRYGGCGDAYSGPNSHRICGRCRGSGTLAALDADTPTPSEDNDAATKPNSLGTILPRSRRPGGQR